MGLLSILRLCLILKEKDDSDTEVRFLDSRFHSLGTRRGRQAGPSAPLYVLEYMSSYLEYHGTSWFC